MMTFYEMENYMKDYSKMRLQEAETQRMLQQADCQTVRRAKFNLVEMARKLIGFKYERPVWHECAEAA
jgi:hypothetical protein